MRTTTHRMHRALHIRGRQLVQSFSESLRRRPIRCTRN